MKILYFNPDKWCTGTLCNSTKFCVIGQCLRQITHCDKKWLKKETYNSAPYVLFQEITGLSPNDTEKLHTINDSEIPNEEKIKQFREIFKKHGIKFVVTQKDVLQ